MSQPILPPPTNFQRLAPGGGVSQPWMDWYVRLVAQTNTSAPEAFESISAALAFLPPPTIRYPNVSPSSQDVLGIRSLLPPQQPQYPSFNAVESQVILAGQIFGP